LPKSNEQFRDSINQKFKVTDTHLKPYHDMIDVDAKEEIKQREDELMHLITAA
jgi:hypothetical protein